jgi:hypothetical protein
MITPDFRALAQELLQHARIAQKVLIGEGLWDDDDQDEGLFDRADKALVTPPPEPPTDEELRELWMGWNLGWDPEKGAVVMPHPAEYARAVLERWGNQATITQTHNN